MQKPVQIVRIGLFFVLWFTACAPIPAVQTPGPTSTKSPTPTLEASPTSSLVAQQYLSDAINIIEKNALNSKKVDWEQVRAMASMFEKNGGTPADTYDTIGYVLRQLEDKHSFFLSPENADQLNSSTVNDYPEPEGKLLENRIGYVAVYEFGAQAEEEINNHADKIQSIIIDLDEQSACGWIVDLREDRGGNMYPMIAGLGALIGEGDLGSFKNASGEIVNWYYRDGRSGVGNTSIAKVSHPEFLLNPSDTPVAVMIGRQTASSGEATAISFRGRPNTRFFGEPSHGLTTGNESFVLMDGATIFLTTVVELDRTGQEYGGKILPDVETSSPETEAAGWLLAQPACNK